MTWLDLVWASACAAAILFIPGYLLARVAGLRGLWSYALSAPFSMTAISIAATVFPLLGVTWSITWVLATTAVLAVIIVGLRRIWTRWTRWPTPLCGEAWRFDRFVPIALLIAGAVITVQVVAVVGAPDNFSQTFDNVFHLNAIRFILDTSNASSLSVGLMTSPNGTLPFYPASWHDLVSLVVQLSGVSISGAINAVSIVVSAFVWPAGAILLTRTLLGSGRIVTTVAGVVSAALPTFPLLLLDYGVLYPFHLGVSMVPAALAAVVAALRLAHSLPSAVPPSWYIVIIAGMIPALTLTHPGAFMAVLAFSLPLVSLAFVRGLRSGAHRGWLTTGFVTYLIAGAAAFYFLRPPAEARGWPPIASIPTAFANIGGLSLYGNTAPAVLAAVLMLAGVVAVVRMRSRSALTVLLLFAVGATVYVTAMSAPHSHFRGIVTGAWYSNPPRLAALFAVVIVPLAALGASWLVSLVHDSKLGRAVRTCLRRRWRIALSVAGVAALVVASQLPAMPSAVARAHDSYQLTANSSLINTDEMEMFRVLPELVPPDAVIAGNPWTGTSLAYAFADRHVLMPHLMVEGGSDLDLINEATDEAIVGSAVCAALQRTGVSYVLDFGDRELWDADYVFAGFDDLAHSSAVELVEERGTARLYRIVGCE